MLGEDVFNSVQATTTWEGPDEVRTSCVKALFYAGHSVVIDVLVTRHDAINQTLTPVATYDEPTTGIVQVNTWTAAARL